MIPALEFALWPIIVYGILVLLLVGAMVVLSHVLGHRHSARTRDEPYESGIAPSGSARVRYFVGYYLVGVFFIIFDVEAVLIFAWAIAHRQVGWAGYIEILLFIVTLAVGLVYVWKLGGLDWYRSRASGGERS